LAKKENTFWPFFTVHEEKLWHLKTTKGGSKKKGEEEYEFVSGQ
jgi:hypothetical protein